MPDPDPRALIWRAETLPDPSWPAPGSGPGTADDDDSDDDDAEAAAPRRRTPFVLGLVALGLALLVALVAVLGGFGARTDQRVPTAAGAPISTGPFVYTFTRATAQLQDSLGTTGYRVLVYGTVRNTGDTGQQPTVDQFVARNPVDAETETPQVLKTGTAEDYTVGNTVTPGLPATAFRAEFDFRASWQPGSRLRFGVADLSQQQLTLGGKDPHLEADASTVYVVELPLQLLPPKTT